MQQAIDSDPLDVRDFGAGKRGMILSDRVREVRSEDDVRQVLGLPCALVLKHSTRCSVSARAFSIVGQFADENPGVPVFIVPVIECRSVSNFLAASLNVRHQSPQVLLLRDGEVVWHASHFAIALQALNEAIGKANRMAEGA